MTKIDVRGVAGNFFPGLKERLVKMAVGDELEIIQDFEPIPLYAVLDELGFEHNVEKRGGAWHLVCRRERIGEDSGKIPFRPGAITNFPMIDKDLGDIVVNFWDLTWNDSRRHLPQEMRLLLSLANAVGAGRIRQATRELVKAYIHGLDSAALDDVFELIAWNQGIGFFSSEIGPSPLFAAYKFIKQSEKRGAPRAEICKGLTEKFGEKNPEVKV